MESMVAIAGAVPPALAVLYQARVLLTPRPRTLPPERDDGVAIRCFETDPVEHPTIGALRRRRRLAYVAVVVIAAACVLALFAVAEGLTGSAAVVLGEVLLLLMWPALELRRSKEPGVAADSSTASLRVKGSIESVASRVQTALFEMGALGLAGTKIVADGAAFSIEGGVGLWGVDGDKGYRLQARAVCVGDGCEVVVTSSNYAPSLIQSLRNHRNVARVVRHLVA
ncbi:MAG TPA: hypothetical protein VM938_16435 [Acidimicrobiales bacterium]|nr:hypothetical protein [Acidimicrobiales bacterium]